MKRAAMPDPFDPSRFCSDPCKVKYYRKLVQHTRPMFMAAGRELAPGRDTHTPGAPLGGLDHARTHGERLGTLCAFSPSLLS